MTIITRRHVKAAALALSLCGPAQAADLSLPESARLMLETLSEPGSYRLPTGPWRAEQGIPVTRIEGRVTRQAWRIDSQSVTPLQLLAPLRAQLEAAGFEVVYECAASACGGFDFRFETEVLPGPDMYVNLSGYRFLSAIKPNADTEAQPAALSLLVSSSRSAGFVQIIRVMPFDAIIDSAPGTTPAAQPATDLIERLERTGHVVLRDLRFASGTAGLGEGAVASLDRIATYLAATPARRIVFVGHTDATGSLAANIALSRRRAMAAVDYLVTRHDTPRDQIMAEGVGYLSPLSTNLTKEGRLRNRRIEAVLIDAD